MQSIWAVPFFSSTPLDGLKNSVADYNVDQFREILKASYHFHRVNKSMSFDVETALLRKCEHKSLDTARLYQMVHDFQELKKAIQETKDKTRTEYVLKGGASAVTGIAFGAFALFAAWKTHQKWEAILEKNQETVHAGIVAGTATISVPALYYAYTTGQLSKAWNYEENRTKLATIEQDIQQIAKIIQDRAQSFADDDTKKVLKNFVEEMNISGAQR